MKSNEKIKKNTQACFLKLAGTFYVQVRVKVLDQFFLLASKNTSTRNWYSKKDWEFVTS